MNKIKEMREELKCLAKLEAYRLWRIARRAQRHGVSQELVHAIREEANTMYTTMTTYPDRLLDWDFKYKFKYAFRY